MKESYKKIKGYAYEVSNFGNIRSLDKYQDFPLFAPGNKRGNKVIMTPILRKGKQMKLTLSSSTKYLCVGLFKDKKHKYSLVHRLVAENFLPKIAGKKQVNHKDSNRCNNHVTNLEWCTSKENMIHGWEKGNLGKIPNFLFANNCKLTDSQVKELRIFKKNSNLPNYKIAEKYGLTRRAIDRIITKESYGWVN